MKRRPPTGASSAPKASAEDEPPASGTSLAVAVDTKPSLSRVSAEPSANAAGEFRMLRLKEVMRLTGLARSTLYALIAQERFPAQVKLNIRSVAWRSDQVATWLTTRTAA